MYHHVCVVPLSVICDARPVAFLVQTEDDGDDRRTWHFRCDMAEEMTLWIEAFSKAVHM